MIIRIFTSDVRAARHPMERQKRHAQPLRGGAHISRFGNKGLQAAVTALRRRAAACLHCPRPAQQPRPHSRRRADRQPRPHHRRGNLPNLPPHQPDRHHRVHGHPQLLHDRQVPVTRHLCGRWEIDRFSCLEWLLVIGYWLLKLRG